MYYMNSPVGIIRIHYDARSKKFFLFINEVHYRSFNNMHDIISSLRFQFTGCFQWDSLDLNTVEIPDLDRWHYWAA